MQGCFCNWHVAFTGQRVARDTLRGVSSSPRRSLSGPRGGRDQDHRERWLPAEDLGAFNEAIMGQI